MAVVDPISSTKSFNIFPSSLWGNNIVSCTSFPSAPAELQYKRHAELKESGRNLILSANVREPTKCFKLIDDIHHLSVFYHFEDDLNDLLSKTHASYIDLVNKKNNGLDLYSTSLGFRILRKHGYNIPSDVFTRFTDGVSGKFIHQLKDDTRGMLSLHEASHLGMHGENILDDAMSFTKSHLEEFKANHKENPLHQIISSSLVGPIHKTPAFLKSRKFMLSYRSESLQRQNLLDFAKLDFNINQMVFRQEMVEMKEWWNDQHYSSKVPYARDRIIESYFWSLIVATHPQYSTCRRHLADGGFIIASVDDMYDSRGKYEDLCLLTEAFQRWDHAEVAQLPEYMRGCFQLVTAAFKELKESLALQGKESLLPYVVTAYKAHVQGYMSERDRIQCGIFPSTSEHIELAKMTSAMPYLLPIMLATAGDEEGLKWLSGNPKCATSLYTIFRVLNDLKTYKNIEDERKDLPTCVECYMQEHDATEQEAHDKMQQLIINCWKDINEACLYPESVPSTAHQFIIALAKGGQAMYSIKDSYTDPGIEGKRMINDVLLEPIPL